MRPWPAWRWYDGLTVGFIAGSVIGGWLNIAILAGLGIFYAGLALYEWNKIR